MDITDNLVYWIQRRTEGDSPLQVKACSIEYFLGFFFTITTVAHLACQLIIKIFQTVILVNPTMLCL